jgi:hypothetical protein
MTELNLKHQVLTLPNASLAAPMPAHRFIVLVPGFEIDLAAVTSRVWELANASEANILFLGLYSDPEREMSLRRELVTMSAMARDAKVSAEVDVTFEKNWTAAIKSHLRAGDTVVCFAEQRIGSPQMPLSQAVQSSFNVPLYILSGLSPRSDSQPGWPSQVAAWVGSIVIIFVFSIIQVKIDQVVKDGSHILFLILSTPAELGAIWIWNSIVG